METKIKEIFKKIFSAEVTGIKKLSGGISFCTYKVVTETGKAYVFRYGENYENTGGRYIDIGQTFRREKFFFDTISNKLVLCVPHIYIVDDSHELFDYTFEIYDYIEGCSLEELTSDVNDEVYYKIGKIIASINKIKLPDDGFTEESWSSVFSKRLNERLKPLVRDNLINQDEVKQICSYYNCFKFTEDRFFLHLDVRKGNIIYKDGIIGLIDAENAEFGDPLFELARIDVYNEMKESFYKGYMDEMGIKDINRESIQYCGYALEALAFLTNVFIHEIDAEKEIVEDLKNRTIKMKDKILSAIS